MEGAQWQEGGQGIGEDLRQLHIGHFQGSLILQNQEADERRQQKHQAHYQSYLKQSTQALISELLSKNLSIVRVLIRESIFEPESPNHVTEDAIFYY